MTYIIAELGSVPDGSLGNALALIRAVKDCGADAAKLQDHRGERIKGTPPWFTSHESRQTYLTRTSFDQDQWRLIRSECTRIGIDLVVSPFSVHAVRMLEELPVDAYKVASGQVTNLEMLRSIKATKRGCILSSGMSSVREIGNAMKELEPSCRWLMHCTSEYPCAPERVGINMVRELAECGEFHYLWSCYSADGFGLSDHTLGFAASLAAIALGATVIERHVCFDRRGYGSDCGHSMTLDEFARFVAEVRQLDVMLANPVSKDDLVNTPAIQEMRRAFLEQ